jgi:hypothetical protein
MGSWLARLGFWAWELGPFAGGGGSRRGLTRSVEAGPLLPTIGPVGRLLIPVGCLLARCDCTGASWGCTVALGDCFRQLVDSIGDALRRLPKLCVPRGQDGGSRGQLGGS